MRTGNGNAQIKWIDEQAAASAMVFRYESNPFTGGAPNWIN